MSDTRLPVAAPMPDKLVFTVDEFCARHGLSKSELYRLWRTGQGPAVMRHGRWVRISWEAAAAWRAARTRAWRPDESPEPTR
ncbi:MAG TPA: hypothetical protein VGE72_04810 [Azospirillum sp.]